MANQFGTMNEEPASSSNLIVNYLPQTLTDQEFHNLFAEIGPVKTCKIVRNKQNGYSYGFGFVDFIKPEDAHTAISKYNGFQLNGKTLKVAIAKPSDSNHSKNTNVYIRGVPKNFDPNELESIFATYGRLVQFRVLRDPHSSVNKGVAFALYDDKQNADQAIQDMDGKVLIEGADPLQVKIADDQMKIDRHRAMAVNGPSRAGGPMFGRSMFTANYRPNHRYNPMHKSAPPHPSAAIGSGFQMNHHPQQSNQFGPYGASHQSYDYQNSMGGREDCTLFVYNIGSDTDEAALYNLFAPFGTIGKVSVMIDRNTGKSKGYGFVTMPNYEEALYAIEQLDKYPFVGKPLQVSFKTDASKPTAFPNPRYDDFPKYDPPNNGRYGAGGPVFNSKNFRHYDPQDIFPPRRQPYQQQQSQQPFY